MKVLKEWSIEAPWGNIALISWGNPAGSPVLLVHGRQDSVATFIPLLEHLSDRYHYVGFDLPGNGRSDPFPHGIKVSRTHFIAPVQMVIDHLKWDKFAYLSHSMGCDHGMFYNAAYPGKITKMIFLDFGPSLQRLQVHNPAEYYQDFYLDYYTNYDRYNSESKLYTRQQATEAVMRARGLSEAQARVILSRNLVPVAGDTCRLSWDRRLKTLAPQNYPVEYYIQLFSKHSPPTLILSATNVTSNPYSKGKSDAAYILNHLEKNVENFTILSIEGGHDVHVTNPERLAEYVKEFLGKEFVVIKGKRMDKANEEFVAFVEDVREFYKCKL